MSKKIDRSLEPVEVALDAQRVQARLDKFIVNRVTRAEDILAEADGRSLSDTEFAAFRRTVEDAASYSELRSSLRKIKREKRAQIRVKEARTYGPDSPHSFYNDLRIVSAKQMIALPGLAEAEARLRRHQREVDYEVRCNPKSREAKRARQVAREEQRSAMPAAEYRAGTSSTMAGFTTPQFLVDEFHHVPVPVAGISVAGSINPLAGYRATGQRARFLVRSDGSTTAFGGCWRFQCQPDVGVDYRAHRNGQRIADLESAALRAGRSVGRRVYGLHRCICAP